MCRNDTTIADINAEALGGAVLLLGSVLFVYTSWSAVKQLGDPVNSCTKWCSIRGSGVICSIQSCKFVLEKARAAWMHPMVPVKAYAAHA